MIFYGSNKALEIIRQRNDVSRGCHLRNKFSTLRGVGRHPGPPQNGHLIGGFQIWPVLKGPENCQHLTSLQPAIARMLSRLHFGI